MKTDSLPSNQQYMPFSGKRLRALKGGRPLMNRAGTATGFPRFHVVIINYNNSSFIDPFSRFRTQKNILEKRFINKFVFLLK